MASQTIDLDLAANQLGWSKRKLVKHLTEAIDAGFLTVVGEDGDNVLLEATIPDEAS